MDVQKFLDDMAMDIETGDYKEIQKSEHNGKQEVRVMFSKRINLYVYEDGNITVRLLLRPEEFPYTYEDLMEKYKEDFKASKDEKIAKWKAQKEFLESKIEDLENEDKELHQEKKEKSWYDRIIRRNKL